MYRIIFIKFRPYNEQDNRHITDLISRLKIIYTNPEEWRIATALVLWHEKEWSKILESLDNHNKRIAEKVITNKNSPVKLYKDRLILKRWVNATKNAQDTISFTSAEESLFLSFLRDVSFKMNSKGYITNENARALLGLTSKRPEVTQLSSLFRKWNKAGFIEKSSKRNEWKFIKK